MSGKAKLDIRFRIDSHNERHVRTTVFVGKHGKTRANIGTLCWDTEEWYQFASGIRRGTFYPVAVLEIDHVEGVDLPLPSETRVGAALAEACEEARDA